MRAQLTRACSVLSPISARLCSHVPHLLGPSATPPRGLATTAARGITCEFRFRNCLTSCNQVTHSWATILAASMEAPLRNCSRAGWNWAHSIPSIGITPPRGVAIANPGWMAPNTKQFEKSISRRDIVCCLMSTQHGGDVSHRYSAVAAHVPRIPERSGSGQQ